MAQLLLPGPCKDTVESGAETYVKDVDCGGAGVAEQVFQTTLYVNVCSLCVGPVSGVVRLAKLSELQCGASVCAGCNGVLHLSLWFTMQN